MLNSTEDDYVWSYSTDDNLSGEESVYLLPDDPLVNCTRSVPNASIPPSHMYVMYKIIMDVYIVGILCLAGFIGNILSIVVLNRDKEKQNTTNWLLQTLAAVDIVYLIACLFIQPFKTVQDLTDWSPRWLKVVFPYVEPYSWGVASIAQTGAVWLVLLVTVDRYVAVCLPWQNQWRSLTRAKVAVAVILITATVYNIPRFLEREIIYRTDCETGEVTVLSQKTEFRNSRLYFLVYKTVCYFIFRTVGPLTTLIVLNSRLMRELQVIRRRHRDLTKRSKHRENITTMLIVVVTVFIVCQLPDLGVRIAVTISEFAPTVNINFDLLRYANAASNTLLALNSSVNFVIYCLVGKKFRKILVKICRCSRNAGSPKQGFDNEVSETEHVPLNVSTQSQGLAGREVLQKYVKAQVENTTNGNTNIQIH